MIVKLIPKQIPTFWEVIKSCSKEDYLLPEAYQSYYNELLHALLSYKAQCFVQLDKDRLLTWITITRLQGDLATGEKALKLQAMDFWMPAQNINPEEYMDILKKFAKQEGCSRITFETSNKIVMEKVQTFGFVERVRQFDYRL